MSEFSDDLDRLESVTGRIADNLERAKKASSSLTSGVSAAFGGGVGSGARTTASLSSGLPSSWADSAGTPYSGAGSSAGSYTDFMDPASRKKYAELVASMGGSKMSLMGYSAATALSGGLGFAAALFPKTQTAQDLDLLSNRYSFYQGGGAGTNNAFRTQRQLSAIGTPINALDAVVAGNEGARMGLLPGLKNYSPTSDFGGVLGGAALMSNLLPGLGLQGGMAAMGGLNTARGVNMLRMIGVNVRSKDGKGMNNLPDIINQVYNMLETAGGKGSVTPDNIAISAMSGNALDSILNQYFSFDPALRQGVLAGLIQMANTKGTHLGTSGTNAEMQKTGGSTAAVASLSGRASAELGFTQAYTPATLRGMINANTGINSLYAGMNKLISNSATRGLVSGLAGINTIGGIAGGAGASLIDSMVDATSGALLGVKSRGKIAAILGLGAMGAAGAYFNKGTADTVDMTTPALSAAGQSSPVVLTGNVTIQVTAPASTDASSWATEIGQALYKGVSF